MTDCVAFRVRVLQAWDDIPFDLPLTTTIGDVKRRALAAARITTDPSAYLVKFRGAEVSDENLSLGAAGVPPGGALIAMRRRRVPVR
jgi:hypothetical protein